MELAMGLAGADMDDQLLSAHLQQADPIMYDIIEKVRRNSTGPATVGDGMLTCGTGENQAKAVHQPDSVRELHLAGRARRSRESDAECVALNRDQKGGGSS